MKKAGRIFPVSYLDKEYHKLYSRLSSVSLPSGCLDLTTYIISELFANVQEHSFAKKVTTEFRLRKEKFYFSVSDNGIGLRKSFLQNGIFAKDDRAAVQLAVGGISTKKKNERAFGLFSILRLTEKANGKMTIRSDRCMAVFQRSQITFTPVKKNKGVTVSVMLPLKAINIYEILY